MDSTTLRRHLDLLATIVMLLAAASVIGLNWRRIFPPERMQFQLPKEFVSVGKGSVLGSRTAPIAIVEFSDFQCPYCGHFAKTTLPLLVDEYIKPGLALLVFKHFPLTAIHPLARKASEFAACGARLGRFNEVHDLLFENPGNLKAVLDFESKAPISEAEFQSCAADGIKADIEEDMELAERLGVTGTPLFLLGPLETELKVRATHSLQGSATIEQFRRVLDSLVKR